MSTSMTSGLVRRIGSGMEGLRAAMGSDDLGATAGTAMGSDGLGAIAGTDGNVVDGTSSGKMPRNDRAGRTTGAGR